MVGSLGGKSLCFCKHVWKIRRNVKCQPGVLQHTISDRLLFISHFVQYRYVNIVHEKLANFACIASNCTQRLDKHLPDGTSWSSSIWRGAHSTVAHRHALHHGRTIAGHQSMPHKHITDCQRRVVHRHAMATQNSSTASHKTEQKSHDSVASPQSSQQPRATHVKLQSAITAAKFSDWGIYNYKAVVAYDGTAYKGFQLQRGERNTVPTVQGVLERALCQIRQESRETLRMQSSGRTDAGVHAKGQVINFYSHKLVPDCTTMMHSLTRMLPDDVSVRSMQRVPPDFHARFTAMSKVYHYHLTVAAKVDPFTRWYSGRVQSPVDLSLMRQAADLFIGQHDFTHFANLGNPDPNPVKTIRRFDILPNEHGFVFQVEGNGFLYKMVRHMVGALLAVGAGNLLPDVIAHKLALGKTQLPGEKYRGWSIAVAQGLFLMDVKYPVHDDPGVLCHPDIEHDCFGRPLVGSITGEE
ncbi:TPA: hypothetical protein ACH3X2_012548 [Trebouxia sp. C0005]